MTLTDNIKLAVEFKTYKFHIYQIEKWNAESDAPLALFYHEEDAQAVFSYLCDKYQIRFVMTNVRTGESYVG